MSGQLGIGIRVFVGWVDSSKVDARHLGERCQTAVIIDGPFPPGQHILKGLNRAVTTTNPNWRVRMESSGNVLIATEDILFPIDDDDAKTERERIENPERAEA